MICHLSLYTCPPAASRKLKATAQASAGASASASGGGSASALAQAMANATGDGATASAQVRAMPSLKHNGNEISPADLRCDQGAMFPLGSDCPRL